MVCRSIVRRRLFCIAPSIAQLSKPLPSPHITLAATLHVSLVSLQTPQTNDSLILTFHQGQNTTNLISTGILPSLMTGPQLEVESLSHFSMHILTNKSTKCLLGQAVQSWLNPSIMGWSR